MKNKKQNPKLSIITVSFNQVEFLERTIKSVINQSYKNIEFIIIDGGSTDGSIEILKRYDKYIEYWVSEKDNGQTHGINKGFRKATGDFVCFQNSDDIFYPGAFESFVQSININTDYSLFYADHKIIDQNDNVLDMHKLMPVCYFLQVFKGPLIHNQACFWKRSIFKHIGYLDEEYNFDMDYEFFTRVLYHGYKAKYIPEYLGAFRLHANTKTSNLKDVSKIEMRQVKLHYKNLRFTTSLIPLSVGTLFGKAVKIVYHLFSLDIKYILRKKINKNSIG